MKNKPNLWDAFIVVLLLLALAQAVGELLAYWRIALHGLK